MKKILQNESGIALLMVSTAIVILSVIMINFTYDTNVNKIQAFNIEDKAKAKLTAEAGLNFAMVRLRLYKEAFNFLEKNQAAKDIATPEVINAIWNFPFVYPIPVMDNMNQVQKESIGDFMESSMLEGNLQLTIQNISNRINLNMLRISALQLAKEQANQSSESPSENETEQEQAFSVGAQLFKALDFAIQRKARDDEEFANRYYGIEIQELVDVLVTYLSDPDTAEVNNENLFIDENMEPKRASMASFSEMRSLPLWTDDLVDLIQRDFTVHGGLMIDLNNITAQTLRLLIPDLMDEDIDDFFKYKNDPNNPVYFNTVEQFKNYWVNQASVISETDFDEIFKKFEAQGLKFGPSPTIFKVISEGINGRASYKLTAYVVIPAQPQPEAATNGTEDDIDGDGIPNDDDDDMDGDGVKNDDDAAPKDPKITTSDGNSSNTTQNKEKQKTQLLEPRIVEIFIN